MYIRYIIFIILRTWSVIFTASVLCACISLFLSLQVDRQFVSLLYIFRPMSFYSATVCYQSVCASTHQSSGWSYPQDTGKLGGGRCSTSCFPVWRYDSAVWSCASQRVNTCLRNKEKDTTDLVKRALNYNTKHVVARDHRDFVILGKCWTILVTLGVLKRLLFGNLPLQK